jgi:hypothetical protein
MKPLSTLPRRSWLERVSLGLAIALIVLGAGTLMGWWLQMPELVQPFRGQAPLKINGAIGFLVLGFVLLAVELGKRRIASLAAVATTIALLTMAEDILHRDLRIDELFGRDHLLINTEHPGRVATMVAVGLLLASVLLVWRATERGASARVFAEAVVGSVLSSAGLSTALGYIIGLPAIYAWGTETATSPVAAVALLLLGLALVVLAWRDTMKAEGNAPAWSPMPAVIGCLTLTVILWIGLRAREQTFTTTATQSQMDQFAIQIKDLLEKQAIAFEKTARSWGDGQANAFAVWEADAKRQMVSLKELGCLSVAFVDIARQTKWIYPTEQNEAGLTLDHSLDEERRNAIAEAWATRGPVISNTTKVIVPGKTVDKGIII